MKMLRGHHGSRAVFTVLGHCRFLVPIFSDRWNFVVAIFYCYLKFEMIFIDNTDTSGAAEWAFHGREGERERESESKLEPKTETETESESIKTQLWLTGGGGNWGKQLPDTKSKATTQGKLTHIRREDIVLRELRTVLHTHTHIFACQ